MTPAGWLEEHWRPVAAVAGLVLAFAAGWYTVPTHVETHEAVRVVYRDREVQAKAETQVVYRDRTVVVHKDGSVEKRDIEQTSNGRTETKATETTKAAERTASKVSDAPKAQWLVGPMVGLGLDLKPVYGAHVERRIVGPVWAGAWGLGGPAGFTAAGVSVSLEF